MEEESTGQPEQEAAEEESSEQSEQEEEEEVSSEQSEQEVEEKEATKQPEQKETAEDDSEESKSLSTIPELDEIAKEVTSYQEFVASVIEKFELGGRPEVFRNLINAAEQVQKISWGALKAFLVKNNIVFSSGDQTWCTNQVAEKRRESQSDVTILKLIKSIVEYKTFDFTCKEEEKTDAESLDQPKQEEAAKKTTEIEVVTPNTSKVKMECMPEIPRFEEILKSVDKTQTVEEMSEYILKEMGLVERSSREQQYLIGIVSVALETDIDDLESICDKAGIPAKNRLFAQMTFSRFINDYVEMFYPDNVLIKGIVFLKELREILMS